MKLRRRRVTIEPDVEKYVEAVTPMYPGFDRTWPAILWTLEHRADQIGEPLAGATRIATEKMNRHQPPVTIVYKLSEDTVHVLDIELDSGR